MRKVELRMNEQEKYEVIKELVDHNGNKNRASKKLGISRRQIDRLIIKYKEKGKSGFVHGNRGHIPTKALDKSISEDIILLYRTKYQDFNFNHFKEYLEEEENINVSYDFIYKHLKARYTDSQGILTQVIDRDKIEVLFKSSTNINNKLEDERLMLKAENMSSMVGVIDTIASSPNIPAKVKGDQFLEYWKTQMEKDPHIRNMFDTFRKQNVNFYYCRPASLYTRFNE